MPNEWIEWRGGERPVAADVPVDLKFRDGRESIDWPAEYWVWTHEWGNLDIVAYRIAAPVAAPQEPLPSEQLLRQLAKAHGREMGLIKNPYWEFEYEGLKSFIVALLEDHGAAPVAPSQGDHAFKNFHRLLCERFDYTHDEIDWKRDQLSLIEWIAGKVAAPVAAPLEPQPATYGIIDPDYARVFTIARCLAWAEGYALAMHGSFTRDLDLIAFPWTDTACAPEHLIKRIAKAADLRLTGHPPGEKPHGRLAWTLLFPTFADPRFVDIGVMPRINAAPIASDAAPVTAPQEDSQGYVDAFYQIGQLLGLSAQPASPREVFETQMLPQLKALLSDAPPVVWIPTHSMKSIRRGCDDVESHLFLSSDSVWAKKAPLEPLFAASVAAPAQMTADDVADAVTLLSDGQRKALFSSYCVHCGSDDPFCQCWNDE